MAGSRVGVTRGAGRIRRAADAGKIKEHELGAVPRYTVMLSEAGPRDGTGVLRGGAEFAVVLDLGTLVRGVAACGFLEAAALPGATAVFARLLLGAGSAARGTPRGCLITPVR